MKLCGLICLYTIYNLCEIHIIWYSGNDSVGYNTIISVAGSIIIIINIFLKSYAVIIMKLRRLIALYVIYYLCDIDTIQYSRNDFVVYNLE
jgi:hypothetical protein